MCGSIRECVHDNEKGHHADTPCAIIATTKSTTISEDSIHPELESYFEMVSNAPIMPNCEVFNTYGEHLGNAQLLTRYGFTINGNEHDQITWDLEELWGEDDNVKDGQGTSSRSGQFERITKLWMNIMQKGAHKLEALLSESELVYMNNPVEFWTVGPGTIDSGMFCLNGDGKITHQMWIYCGLLELVERHDPHREIAEEILDILCEAADSQVKLENEMTRLMLMEEESAELVHNEGSDVGAGTRILPTLLDRGSSKTPTVVTGVIRKMLALCHAKKSKSGKREGNMAETSQLGALADVRVMYSVVLVIPCLTYYVLYSNFQKT